MNNRSSGPSFPEISTYPRSPGHGRGIITWAQRDSDVPTLSRAWPWYHHVGTMNIRSQGPSFENSRRSHALQGMAVVSSRRHDKTQFLGTEHSWITY